MEKETQVLTPPATSDPDEIDLLVLAKTLWNGRKIILKSTLICGVLGIVVALSTPNEYTAKTVLVPQMRTDSQGGLSGIAALAGINVGISQNTTEVSPIIYPLIIKSIPFQLELMNTPIQFKDNSLPISLLDHNSSAKTSFDPIGLLKKFTIGLPSLILNALRGENKEIILKGSESRIIYLTEQQKSIKNQLESIINLTINNKEGYFTLTATMPDAFAAAQLAQKTIVQLQRYIIDYKIQKSKAELEFIQERFNEKKIEFEHAQENLAMRIDRNKNFTSGISSIETDRIQAKYSLTFSVYTELAKQLEQGKIQVKKETPVFTTIEPVTIPTEKSKPKRLTILLIYSICGGIVGIGVVFGKTLLAPLKKLLDEIINNNAHNVSD